MAHPGEVEITIKDDATRTLSTTMPEPKNKANKDKRAEYFADEHHMTFAQLTTKVKS